MEPSFNFGKVLIHLRAGQRVARAGWNGKGMFLFLVEEWAPEGGSGYPTAPFICMKTADDKIVPWLASQTDLLAEDWQVVG